MRIAIKNAKIQGLGLPTITCLEKASHASVWSWAHTFRASCLGDYIPHHAGRSIKSSFLKIIFQYFSMSTPTSLYLLGYSAEAEGGKNVKWKLHYNSRSNACSEPYLTPKPFPHLWQIPQHCASREFELHQQISSRPHRLWAGVCCLRSATALTTA